MEIKGAPVPATGRICRGLRSVPSFEEGGYNLAVDVEERGVLP